MVSDKVTIDRAGRLVLPKWLCDELRLSAGDVLEITTQDDRIILRTRGAAAPLEKERGIGVLRTGKSLTAAEAEETKRKICAQRHEQGVRKRR